MRNPLTITVVRGWQKKLTENAVRRGKLFVVRVMHKFVVMPVMPTTQAVVRQVKLAGQIAVNRDVCLIM